MGKLGFDIKFSEDFCIQSTKRSNSGRESLL